MLSQDTSSSATSNLDTSSSNQVTPTSSASTSVTQNPTTSTTNSRTPLKTRSPDTFFNEKFGFEVVKISVGTGTFKQDFHIHKNILCQNVSVFDRMLNGSFAESQSGQASLPEDDPRVFDMLSSWLYSSSVPSQRFGDFIRLFILAEKYGIHRLTDNTMDALIQYLLRSNFRPSAKETAQAYEGTREGSKMRLFMSRCWAYGVLNDKDSTKWPTSSLVPIGEKSTEILIDGMDHLRNMNTVKLAKGKQLMCNPKKAPPCDYHHHGKDEACPYTKPPKRKLDEINV
ncbi:hypothetical protein BKA64DRAFT_711884 [Cadophora sp. MPI-SDFR-AT-0126]|nr:hypothetical protein BKA64DRAFT_711884 [Leotiomycetes sp. MPI-SDFR-AT-0126]